MLYKKSEFGRKYTRYISSSPVVFISFVMLGMGLILSLMFMTQIDVIKTYAVELIPVRGHITLSIQAGSVPAGRAYLYANKQEVVYPVRIDNADQSTDYTTLHVDKEDQEMIHALSSKKLFIDIPQGKESLLYRIFVRGGKSRE
ncbi:hypothetical protein [Paenibacillus eucommiae]|uniref:Uncharacterized protein n=1 Tax=Paenibacillus eucommiae TaxID=1355755 RepID=A0ABS4IT98_9BACL|nr:hypothetical protein [Paenibacillus eucommiae]MBP1990787.1 hypothetical protein [Paenibacillus eucommiae]